MDSLLNGLLFNAGVAAFVLALVLILRAAALVTHEWLRSFTGAAQALLATRDKKSIALVFGLVAIFGFVAIFAAFLAVNIFWAYHT